MTLRSGLLLALILSLFAGAACSGGASPQAGKTGDLSPRSRPSAPAGAAKAATPGASAAPSASIDEATATAPACADPPPPIPRGSDRASFILQDGHTAMIIHLGLSGSGRLLASTGLDGTARIWDTKTGLQLRRIQTQGASLSTSLSAEGAVLAYLRTDSAAGPSVATVALETGKDAKSLDAFGNFQIAPDGKTLAIGWKELEIRAAGTGEKLRSMRIFDPPAKAPAGAKLDPAYDYNMIRAVGFDRAGTRLAVATGLEVALVDMATWKVLWKRPHGMGVPAAKAAKPAPPPNTNTKRPGSKAAPAAKPPAGPDPSIINPGWFPSSILLSGDALVLMSVPGALILSARDGGSPRPLPSAYLSAAVLGDKLLTTDALQRVAAFHLATGAPASVPGIEAMRGWRLAVSADGSTLALASTSASKALASSGLMDIRIYDARTMRLLRAMEPRLATVETVAVSPDGSTLMVASRDGTLARWSLRSGELQSSTKGTLGVMGWSLAYDPTGERVVLMNGSRHVRVHDGKTGLLLRQWEPTGQVIAAAWFVRATKELATLDAAGAIKLWDVAPPVPARRPIDMRTTEVSRPTGRDGGSIPGPVATAAASPDGSRVAAVTADRFVTTPDPTGRAAYKDVHAEANIALAEAQSAGPGGATGAYAVRWTTRVAHGYTGRWVGFAPDGESVVFSSMEDSRGWSSKRQTISAPPGQLRVFHGKTGALARTAPSPTMGPVGAGRGALIVGGRSPTIFAWPSLAQSRVDAPDYLVNGVASNPVSGAFVLGGDSGGTTLAAPTGSVTTILASSGGTEYVTATLDGTFRSSLDGARSVAWTFGEPLEGFSFEQFAARFARPDIIQARLAGEEPPAPASLIRPPVVAVDRASVPVTPLLTRSLRLKARVESPRRVDRVRAFVNGRPAADKAVCASKGEVELEVPVLLGRNRLTVVAYDADGYASNPETIDVTSAAPSSSRPDLWVVAVGVSKYKNLGKEHQLEFADDDAQAVAKALSGYAGPGLPFGASRVTTLLDDEVTVEGVARALAGLSGMGPDDLAVVFLAGHGVALEQGKMVYLTSGATLTKEGAKAHGVGWEAIRASLARARGRVVVLLDACHSGHVTTDLIAPNEALAQELSAGGRSGVLVFAASRGSQLSYEVPAGTWERKAGSPGGAALGSSRGLELAWEGKRAEVDRPTATGHGLFTSAVLEALSGGAPDADRSGAVEVGELVDYVTERVREVSNGQQTPWVARREMFGDFMIAPVDKN
jgi:WD40 repeat protein